MKRFNTTGICFPDKHYMVDISERKTVSLYEKYIELGLKFCFLRTEGNVVKIANRILESVLYNMFIAEDQNQPIYTEGSHGFN